MLTRLCIFYCMGDEGGSQQSSEPGYWKNSRLEASRLSSPMLFNLMRQVVDNLQQHTQVLHDC